MVFGRFSQAQRGKDKSSGFECQKNKGTTAYGLNGVVLEEVPSIRYLGVLEDLALKLDEQYLIVERNIKFGTAKINRAKTGVTQSQQTSMSNAFG